MTKLRKSLIQFFKEEEDKRKPMEVKRKPMKCIVFDMEGKMEVEFDRFVVAGFRQHEAEDTISKETVVIGCCSLVEYHRAIKSLAQKMPTLMEQASFLEQLEVMHDIMNEVEGRIEAQQKGQPCEE